MNTLIGIIIIFLVVAFLGASRSILHKNIPDYMHLFIASGLLFLVLGIGLGKTGINLINKEVMNDIFPLIQLLLSWVGLIFGSQFKLSLVKQVPVRVYCGVLFQSLFTFCTIFIFSYFTIIYLGNTYNIKIGFDSAIALAAIGCVSSPTLLTLILRKTKITGSTVNFFRLASSTDSMVGIVIMSIFFAIYHSKGNLFSYSYQWYLYQIIISVFLGVIFVIKARLPNTSNEKFVLLLGMLTFSGGVAYITHFSPLFMNMIIGIIMANDNKTEAWLDRQLLKGERPFYLIMLLLLGSLYSFNLESFAIYLIPISYIIAHSLGKQIGVPIATYISGTKACNRRYLGGGLFYQGGIAVAMTLSYLLLSNEINIASDIIISSIILGLIINGLISPNLIKKALTKTVEVES